MRQQKPTPAMTPDISKLPDLGGSKERIINTKTGESREVPHRSSFDRGKWRREWAYIQFNFDQASHDVLD